MGFRSSFNSDTFGSSASPSDSFSSSASNHAASGAVRAMGRPFAGFVNLEYIKLGCFERSPGDDDAIGDFRDKTCANTGNNSGAPCRSGLPFYRSTVESDAAVDQCFRLCTSKGLDVFGVLNQRTECRCGATDANEAVWRKWKSWAISRGLPWAYQSPVDPSGDGVCRGVEVYRYVGWLEEPESEGISRLLLQTSLRDVQYIDAVVRAEKQPAPQIGHAMASAPPGTHMAVTGAFWPRVKGGGSLPYRFAPEVETPAKHAFLYAAKEWAYLTNDCVKFREVQNPADARLVVSDGTKCGPDAPGYPGEGEVRQLHLGGCDSVLSLVSVFHALGAVLGLAVPWEGQGGVDPESGREVIRAYDCT